MIFLFQISESSNSGRSLELSFQHRHKYQKVYFKLNTVYIFRVAAESAYQQQQQSIYHSTKLKIINYDCQIKLYQQI